MKLRRLMLSALLFVCPSVAVAETASEQLVKASQQMGIDSVVGDQNVTVRARLIDGLSGRWLQGANLLLGHPTAAPAPETLAKACQKIGGDLVASESQIRAERPYKVDGAEKKLVTVFVNVSGNLYTRYVDPASVFERVGVDATDPGKQKSRDLMLRFLTGSVFILRMSPDVVAVYPEGGVAELWMRCP